MSMSKQQTQVHESLNSLPLRQQRVCLLLTFNLLGEWRSGDAQSRTLIAGSNPASSTKN